MDEETLDRLRCLLELCEEERMDWAIESSSLGVRTRYNVTVTMPYRDGKMGWKKHVGRYNLHDAVGAVFEGAVTRLRRARARALSRANN